MSRDKKVLKFSSVLKRFEPEIEGGTCFLYATVTDEIWTGNYSVNLLLDLIDGAKTVEKIKLEFQALLQLGDVNAVNNSVDIIFEELIAKGMLVEV